MAGIKLTRAGTLAPSINGTPTPSTQPLGHFLPGFSLLLICRQAENYINATTAPAARQWEGPYLRIRPAMWSGEEKVLSGAAWRIGENGAGSGGNVTPATDGESTFPDGPYYEVDAMSTAPIFLPWECDCELYTDISGIWLFDIYVAPYNPALFKMDQVYAQTRRVAAGATRTLRTPLGCNSFQLGGVYDVGAARSFTQYNEETGKSAGFGSSMAVSRALSGEGGAVYPINNTRRMVVTSPVADVTSVVFQVKF